MKFEHSKKIYSLKGVIFCYIIMMQMEKICYFCENKLASSPHRKFMTQVSDIHERV